jgi:hypothetical protein
MSGWNDVEGDKPAPHEFLLMFWTGGSPTHDAL